MRILVAEDDPVSRRLVEAALRKSDHEVVIACDGVDAWQALSVEDPPRLVILDWMMPGLDGIEVCRRIRDEIAEPYVYVIMLTAKDQKEDIIAGMEAGADDYLVKPFHPHELQARLHAGERILNLQAELVAAREALRRQATHDSLTGLLNRSAIIDVLNREIDRARRHGSALAVVMADIDTFKRLNDTHGHLVGDTVLAETARLLSMSSRSYDGVGRYGGEEFLLVLPGCEVPQASSQAERVRERIDNHVFDIDGARIHVTVSFGIATVSHVSDVSAETLIAAADQALYAAKSAGRNCVKTAPPV